MSAVPDIRIQIPGGDTVLAEIDVPLITSPHSRSSNSDNRRAYMAEYGN